MGAASATSSRFGTPGRRRALAALCLAGYATVVTAALVWRSYIRAAGALPLPPPDGPERRMAERRTDDRRNEDRRSDNRSD